MLIILRCRHSADWARLPVVGARACLGLAPPIGLSLRVCMICRAGLTLSNEGYGDRFERVSCF